MTPPIRNLAGQTVKTIREYLAAHWIDLHQAVAPIGHHLLSLNICSLAFTEPHDEPKQSWIVLRGSDSEQYLLGITSPLSDEVENATWLQNIDGLQDLLTAFGNLQIGTIPPCSGFNIGSRLIREADEELCWGITGKWENALPIFHDGSGNSICVSTDGEIGIWSPRQFQTIAGSLTEFVTMFLDRQKYGTSPESQWWW